MYRSNFNLKMYVNIPDHIHGGKVVTIHSRPVSGENISEMETECVRFRKMVEDSNPGLPDLHGELIIRVNI